MVNYKTWKNRLFNFVVVSSACVDYTCVSASTITYCGIVV